MHSLFRLSLGRSVTLALASAALAVAIALVLLWLAVGKPNLDPVDSVSPRAALDALKFSGGLVIGIGGGVALVVAYRRQRLGEAEHQRQDEASERDRMRLYNERFARASDQLGSDRPAIRLAGIYALAGLADDWEDGRQACIDVLCAYLRMPFRPRGPLPDFGQKHQPSRPWENLVGLKTEGDDPVMEIAGEAQVRSSVIQVLRDHLWSGARVNWHGAHLDFTGAVFQDASFDGMDFTDCTVRFDECLFVGECGFSQTLWKRTEASFLNAVFAGRLGFEYSTFEESNVNFYGDFTMATDVNFQGVTLVSGKLDLLGPGEHGGSISFVSSNLLGGDLEIHGSNLNDGASIAFSRSTLSGANIRLIGGNSYKGGNIWCNGLDIQAGSFTLGSARWAPGPVKLEGTEFSFDDAHITGGQVALRDVLIDGSDVHFDDLEMAGGSLDISSCDLASGTMRFKSPSITGGEVVMTKPKNSREMSAVRKTLVSAGARVVTASEHVASD
jgi:uncharacterized protein YjbI with pentapeptide repeats